MHICILTLFPDMFGPVLTTSIVGRAVTRKLLTLDIQDIRAVATDKHKSVDDHPYGGGNGMVLRVDILDQAITRAKKSCTGKRHVVLLDPQGAPYKQQKAQALASYDNLILVCGHYEGIDQRARALVDEQISIGDYVLTGGEIPAMVIVDSVTRLLPRVLVKAGATQHESFSLSDDAYAQLLEYPQYTRPPVYKRKKVPEVLLSGNHADIEAWKKQQANLTTKKHRPDLLK